MRPPAASFAGGLTTAQLGLPSLDKALEQHARYVEALEHAGVAVTALPPEPDFPDSTFVEDTAILGGTLAVLTRPGAPSRLREVDSIRTALAECFEKVAEIEWPGTVDGGDVCEAVGRYYIGISERTNESGAAQLARVLQRAGFEAETVDIRGMRILHLKSGIAYLGDDTFVVIEDVAERMNLDGHRVITTDPDEDYAANCIRVNDAVLMPAGYPKLARALADAGFTLVELEVSEYRKMDGGLSCLSLRF